MIDALPRREREIFEILCGLGEATAAEIRAAMADPPTRSALRTLLARLEAKGFATHRADGQTYIYKSVPRRAEVRESVLRQLTRTFFSGSPASAAMAMLGLDESLRPEEIATIEKILREAKERAR